LIEPDVEFSSLIAEAEGTTYRGHDGVREFTAARGRAGKIAWWGVFRTEDEALDGLAARR
jgi:hypothetical protein